MFDDRDDTPAKHCKTVLVGEISTGKSSIVNQLVEGVFLQQYSSTISPTNLCKTLQTEKGGIQLDIWDTAGQEKYRGLNKIFYTKSQMAILVYDITNRRSFEELKSYWVAQIKQNCDPQVVIGIAGNKADLFQQAEVSEEEGEQFALEIGAIHKWTSCPENMGIESLFMNLSEKFLMLEDSGENEEDHIVIGKKQNKAKRKCC